MSGELKKIEGNEDILVLQLYYNKDEIGGGNNGDESDEIPDKYQKTVIFKVVNGTWADKKTEDIIKVVTLEKDGKWDENGSAALTAPTGMKANDGFRNDLGAWDITPPATVSGTATETYTYTFPRGTTPIVPGDTVSYIVEHYKADENDEYPAEPTEREILAVRSVAPSPVRPRITRATA